MLLSSNYFEKRNVLSLFLKEERVSSRVPDVLGEIVPEAGDQSQCD